MSTTHAASSSSSSAGAGVVLPAFEDGLGRRYRPAARGDQSPPEILCFRPELTDVPSFEFSLRERVARVAEFRDPSYGRVRKVDRLSDERGTVVLMSDCVPGTRLSGLLAVAEQGGAVLTLDAALCLVRQLIPAMTLLHRQGGVAHGAIAPERLIVTPQGRLIVVEHVTGAALEQLRYSRERYWKELRVALPMAVGVPRFDEFADLTQLGVVALSVILGRPLRDEEFPALAGDLINSAYARGADGGRESLPSGLREWLRRALEVDVRHSFKSLTEAQHALDQLASLDAKDHADVDDLQTFLDECQHPVKKPLAMPPVARVTSIAATPPPRPQERPIEKSREEQPREVEAGAHDAPGGKRHPVRPSARRAWIAAGVMSAMAAGVGLFAARQGFSTQAPALPAAPIALPAGARPPQVVEVPAAAVGLQTGLQTAVQTPADSSAVSSPATDQTAKIEPGWVSVAAPFDMELYEQGKLLGTTGIDRIMLPAGRHDIEVVSEALGYREPHTVNVQPNKVASISITLPKGTLSLNAIPWATVSIDGENAGDTPIGNLALTIGPHEVVFTNPQLGEQRRVITVTQRSPVRFSIDLTKK
jgi:hypothetical protein